MTLTQVVEEYVTVKRSTGLRFRSGAMILRTFTRVAGAIEVHDVTQDTVRAFLKGSGPITSGWHLKHYTLAGLFRFAMQRGLVSTSPVAYRLPKRPAYATPYIYSEEELRRMLDATSALDLPHPKNGQPATIPALTFRTLILLLYGAGLRLGEALALTVDDVDLHTNMLLVRNTKFFKTRWVPIGPRLSSALDLYADTRLAVIRRPPTRNAFLLRRDGIPISLYTAERYFRILRSRIGIRRSDSAYFQPRLHDLRQHAGSRIMPGSTQAGSFSRGRSSFRTCRFGIIRLLSSPRLMGREGRRHAGARHREVRHESGIGGHRRVRRVVCGASDDVRLRSCDDSITAEAARALQ